MNIPQIFLEWVFSGIEPAFQFIVLFIKYKAAAIYILLLSVRWHAQTKTCTQYYQTICINSYFANYTKTYMFQK